MQGEKEAGETSLAWFVKIYLVYIKLKRSAWHKLI